MSRPSVIVVVLYLARMIAVIVGADIAFFRHQFWPRLLANAGVVLVFAAVYLRFIGRPLTPWR